MSPESHMGSGFGVAAAEESYPQNRDSDTGRSRPTEGTEMRAEAIDYRYVESQQHRAAAEREPRESQMTPARRAGLDALEREFQEFLRSHAR